MFANDVSMRAKKSAVSYCKSLKNSGVMEAVGLSPRGQVRKSGPAEVIDLRVQLDNSYGFVVSN
jgi:hypothetical protein